MLCLSGAAWHAPMQHAHLKCVLFRAQVSRRVPRSGCQGGGSFEAHACNGFCCECRLEAQVVVRALPRSGDGYGDFGVQAPREVRLARAARPSCFFSSCRMARAKGMRRQTGARPPRRRRRLPRCSSVMSLARLAEFESLRRILLAMVNAFVATMEKNSKPAPQIRRVPRREHNRATQPRRRRLFPRVTGGCKQTL